MAFFGEAMTTGAFFSKCLKYRYKLWRVWDMAKPPLLIILLNPSKANATENDNTIRWLINYATKNGFGGILVVNLFAFRATMPDDMKRAEDPVGPENDKHIVDSVRAITKSGGKVVVAWGTHGSFKERDRDVLKLVNRTMRNIGHDTRRALCFGHTVAGYPTHPVRLGQERDLVVYEGRP